MGKIIFIIIFNFKKNNKSNHIIYMCQQNNQIAQNEGNNNIAIPTK